MISAVGLDGGTYHRITRLSSTRLPCFAGHARWHDPPLSGTSCVFACCGDDFFKSCNDVAGFVAERTCRGPGSPRSGYQLRRAHLVVIHAEKQLCGVGVAGDI